MTATSALDDASLAEQVAAGDNAAATAALAAMYDRYAGRLFGFCRSMLRQKADAEDCLQDVFIIAATRIGQLSEPALLRNWLFAVARHECLNRIDKRREVLVPDMGGSSSAAADPELAALLQDATTGLSDRDRLVLELGDREELSGDDLAAALGVPRSTASTLLAQARQSAQTSIGTLLVARTGRGECAQLDSMLTGWNGQPTTLRRKQINRHIDRCQTCDARRDRVATPTALLGGGLLAGGRAFAAELVDLRTGILAAAGAELAAIAAGRSAAAGERHYTNAGESYYADNGGNDHADNGDNDHADNGDNDWVDGWPPTDAELADAEFADVPPPERRWLPALVVLIVLLLAVGGAIGLLSIKGSRAPAALRSAGPGTSASPGGPAGSNSATGPAVTTTPTFDLTIAPAPAAPRAVGSAPPTSSAPASATIVVLTVITDRSPVVISAGGSPTGCAASSTCGFQLPSGSNVTIAATSARGLQDRFSAPPSCTSSIDVCTFTITANTLVRLTSQRAVVVPTRTLIGPP